MSKSLVFNNHYDVFRDFDRWVGNFFNDSSYPAKRTSEVEETEAGYTLKYDLPGLKNDNLKVEVKDSVLSIEAKTETRNEDEGKNYILRERRNLNLSRSYRLPEDVDQASVEAKLNDGVLVIELKKKPKAQPKRIEVQ